MDFDSALSLEDNYYRDGYEEGMKDGYAQGLIEGRIYGSEVSYERFTSLGLLHGRVAVWKAKYATSPKILKQITKVEEILGRVPRDNAETKDGEDLESLLNSAVNRMKVVVSLTGEPSLQKQGIVRDLGEAQSNGDLEDGAEFAVNLKGGQTQIRKGCSA